MRWVINFIILYIKNLTLEEGIVPIAPLFESSPYT